MRLKKNGFTLIEVQIASILMIVVLIATGVIFYFCLASMRYLHDAVLVYSNATSAMKTLTNEIMVSNCYGNAQGLTFPTPQFSFYGVNGYIHGIEQDDTTSSINSGQEALNSALWMPDFGSDIADELYLRQAPQTGSTGGNPATVAGDFPDHDSVAIYLNNDVMCVDVERNGVLDTNGLGDYQVAHFITDFGFQDIEYNCVAVRITATGNVLDPWGNDVYEITLGKMVTLRCAPIIRPWVQ